MAPSSWLSDRMSTSSAVSASRSVTARPVDAGCSHRRPVGAEDVVELALVVTLALVEPLDDEHARHAEVATREAAVAGGGDGDAPCGHLAAADLVPGLGVDHGDR